MKEEEEEEDDEDDRLEARRMKEKRSLSIQPYLFAKWVYLEQQAVHSYISHFPTNLLQRGSNLYRKLTM